MRKCIRIVMYSVVLVGCLDFDAKYAESAARIADGGRDGGVTDAGTGGSDAGADAGSTPSGCDASLCLLGTWQMDNAQVDYWGGLAAGDEQAAVAVGVHRDNSASSNQRYETWFARPAQDGGFTLTKSMLSRLRPNRTDRVTGVANDFWFTDYDGVFHVDGTAELDVTPTTGCLVANQDTGWTSLHRLSSNEALVGGGGAVVCRVNWRTGVTSALLNLNLGYRPWLVGVYQAPDSGTLFIADEYAQVLNGDAGVIGGPFVADPSAWSSGNAISGFDGTGDTVWVLTAEGLVFSNTTGTFAQAFDAGISGRALTTFAPNDVWVGGTGPTVFHFDGTTWQTVRIPNIGTFGYVEAIRGGRNYLHLLACTALDSNFNCAQNVLMTYRRGP